MCTCRHAKSTGLRRKSGKGKRSKARIGPRRKCHKQTKGVEGLPSSELPSPDWRTAVDIPTDTPDMRLRSVSFQEMTGCPPLVVTRSLIIKQDHCWSMYVHRLSVCKEPWPLDMEEMCVSVNSSGQKM